MVIDTVDQTFLQAVLWFFKEPTVVLLSVGFISVVAVLVSVLIVVRKWGDY
ncbi:hypothetical protein ERIC1_10p00060 (plasmid) [Paenibacillus larvae subsp. larvae DSM 25719]|nr:hypothetical protein ERIC1_10p00060 [Paenibacillus larvae subsp. larvae DSM 25719]